MNKKIPAQYAYFPFLQIRASRIQIKLATLVDKKPKQIVTCKNNLAILSVPPKFKN